MSYKNKIQPVLERTENEVRGVIAEALAAGDYDAVVALTEVCTHLSRVRLGLESTSHAGPSHAVDPAGSYGPRPRHLQPPSKGEYPLFRKKNGSLAKIAWSKKHKCEYSHSAPKATYDFIVKAVDNLADQNGKLVEADTVWREAERISGDAIPKYQVYVVLNYLRSCKVLRKVGKSGYCPARPASFMRAAESAWTELQSIG